MNTPRRRMSSDQVHPTSNSWRRRRFLLIGLPVGLVVMAILLLGPLMLRSGLGLRIIAKVESLRLDHAYTTGDLSSTKAATAATAIAEMVPLSTQSARGMHSAAGPLRVHPTNPRYFADGDGNLVYLTGSHTWSNFQDNGGSDPPPAFDYVAYLNFLTNHNHNFFRLWTWEESRWTTETGDDDYWFNPMPPYKRTGSGAALDGKPKFDLTQLEQSYFDRMRTRIIEAGQRNIYVAIVLFNGWSVAAAKGGFGSNNPWQGHPFNGGNNINGIDGDLNGDNSGEEVHTLGNAAVTAFQEAYVRKVIDTVNDLDNVLYEISNESDGSSEEWQYHMIHFIRSVEATKAKQHPIGMTVAWPDGDNADLYNSSADWISPNGDISDPDVADGRKVVLLDTDHLCGICGDRAWVWKAFMRGNNPIFMDGYDGAGYGVGGAGFDFNNPTGVSLRRNLGYTRMYAERIDLAAMSPRGDLASTGYCLAKLSASAEFLVYAPSGGQITVNLTGVTGEFHVEWFDPTTGTSVEGASIVGGATQSFTAPFDSDAVLYLFQADTSATMTPTPTPIPLPEVTVTPTRLLQPTLSPTAPSKPRYQFYVPTIDGS
ncbi:MAG TPA: DUF6298 domain-containing protein [Caldilineaceae bacterium]|nr:DUF6298 domain-containing protein [Caldilineaceae bacterium]